MANISVTSECNRECTYCFARGLAGGGDRATHMTLEVFGRALDLLERSDIDQARLLGGEPTLHPDFSQLVDRALERGLRVLIFSNVLMPEKAVRRLELTPADRVAILANVTQPSECPADQQERQAAVFERLSSRVSLGFNIRSPALELDFLLDLIERFDLSRCVRLGLAHPCVDGDNQFLHPRHYSEVGRRVADFAAQAGEADVTLEFDCGFVPCMFPDEGAGLLGAARTDLGRRCNAIPDILPDGQVVACYPLASLHREHVSKAENAPSLQARFAGELQPYRSFGIFRDCAACSLRQSAECLGGCLAAAMQRLRHVPFTVTAPRRSPSCEQRPPDVTVSPRRNRKGDTGASSSRADERRWLVPYVDQPPEFWEELCDDFGASVKAVYMPLPGDVLGSGRPPQPTEHLERFLRFSPFALVALVNPVVLPHPVEEIAPAVIDGLRRLDDDIGLAGVTVSDVRLAARIREAIPHLSLAASVLTDISRPNQVPMLQDIFDTLVPASRVMRDLPALEALRAAFPGRVRLIVNEACLPGCPFRVQHFCEMASGLSHPPSLCDELLAQQPWMRLTGAWVLPQHLHLYDGLYDELKLAGRVTLRDAPLYRRVLNAYVHRQPLTPNAIGGGPASVLKDVEIEEEFYVQTLRCSRNCLECDVCRDYYNTVVERHGRRRSRVRAHTRAAKASS